MTGKTLLVTRECEALLIPHGYTITLVEGSAVRITQALGDNFTLEVQGNLVLVMGEDRDALGMPPLTEQDHPTLHDDSVGLKEKCDYQMRRCYDPEIPVNIVELGLIYDCQLREFEHDANKQAAHVTMTLTAPTCGMGPVLVEEVKRKVMQLNDIGQVEVELVFDPPWSQEMMSDAARLQLGLL
ncbi:MAG: putative Fe-S cluster assembly protein SufT [Pseudomonadota bacterium]|nr:putative Fe-S cluster assembly protein SufT [Pseudomonadota bacterium]